MNVADEDLARVLALRHRVGDRHSCRCDDCRAILRVVAAARENNARADAAMRRAPPSATQPLDGRRPV